jgi:hypothetical protein
VDALGLNHDHALSRCVSDPSITSIEVPPPFGERFLQQVDGPLTSLQGALAGSEIAMPILRAR